MPIWIQVNRRKREWLIQKHALRSFADLDQRARRRVEMHRRHRPGEREPQPALLRLLTERAERIAHSPDAFQRHFLRYF